MPRDRSTAAQRTLAYFETAPLDAAVLVLELASAKVKARRALMGKPISEAPALPRPHRRSKSTPPPMPGPVEQVGG